MNAKVTIIRLLHCGALLTASAAMALAAAPAPHAKAPPVQGFE